jgi:hypothetical protein
VTSIRVVEPKAAFVTKRDISVGISEEKRPALAYDKGVADIVDSDRAALRQ